MRKSVSVPSVSGYVCRRLPLAVAFLMSLLFSLPGVGQQQKGGMQNVPTGKDHNNQDIFEKKCLESAEGCCPCQTCGDSTAASGTTENACAWITILTGAAAPGSTLPAGFFDVNILQPTPDIYTPARLRYILGYNLQRLSLADTPAGLPRRIEAIGLRAESVVFEFADDDAVGVPIMNKLDQRLVMVDAEGWATAADPAYYDLYPGDGTLYRFSAARHLPGYLSLVLYRNAQGREETPVTLQTSIIFDEFRTIRQVLAPSCLADVTPLSGTAEGYAISFFHWDDVLPQVNGLGHYVPAAGVKPFAVWTFDNPDFTPPGGPAPAAGQPASVHRLRVTKTTGGHSEVSLFTHVSDSDTWELVKGGGIVNSTVENEWNDDRTEFKETKTTFGADGSSVGKQVTEFKLIGTVYRIVRETFGSGNDMTWKEYTYAPPIQTFRYDPRLDNVRPLTHVRHSDGSWKAYTYDSITTEDGRITSESRGWLDSAAGSQQRVTTSYSYTPVVAGDIINSTFTRYDRRPRTVTGSVCGVPVSKTHYAYTRNAAGEAVDLESRAASANAAPFAAGSLTTTRTYYAPGSGVSSGLLKSVEHPDGRMETHTYGHGNYTAHADPSQCVFTPDPNGKAWRHTVTQGTVQNPGGIPGRTLRTAEVFDRCNSLVLSETQVCAAGGVFETISRTANAYNRLARKIRAASTDGTSEEYTWGDNCCGMASKRAADGTETVYEYDAVGRLVAETQTDINGIPALRTAYTLDAAGRRVKTTLSNISGSASLFPALPPEVSALLPVDFQLHKSIVLSQQVYSESGRLLSSTDSQGRVTTYQSANFGKVSTVIAPGGLATVTVRHADGQVAYTEESGVRTATYAYGVDAGGVRWNLSVQGAYDPNHPYASLDVPWTKGTRDFLGRSLTTERPGFGGTVLVSSNAYDTASRLTATTLTTDHCPLSTALYTYDDLSARVLSVQDINQDGIVDLAGPDRVQGSFNYYAKLGNDWVTVSGTVTYPDEASAVAVTNMLAYTWLTGLDKLSPTGIFATHGITLPLSAVLVAKGETHNLTDSDEYTVAANRYTVLDTTSRKRWQIVVSPASGASVTEILNGLTVSTSRYPVPAPNVVPPLPTPDSEVQTSHVSYDPLGRQACTFAPSSTDRLTAAFTQYNAKGQAAWQQDAAGNRTAYVYDALGRRTAVTDTLNQTTHTAYDAKDRITATWGATYPVCYDYDAFGHMIAMYTYRGGTEITSAAQMLSLKPQMDRTSWLYDNPTGLLTNKLYADNLGPSYTYAPDGKLLTRTWARLTTDHQPLITCYSYDNAGSLTNTAYSDNTPTISFTYDRLGRQLSAITDGVSTNLFAYNVLGQLTNETSSAVIASGAKQPSSITRTYDPFGRPSSINVIASGAKQPSATTYGYDAYGRLNTVSSLTTDHSPLTTSYTYLPGTDLLAEKAVTLDPSPLTPYSSLLTTYSYEPNRDLITAVKNQLTTDHWPLTTISQFEYTNDPLGRRVSRQDSGLVFEQPQDNTFGYNLRSEVTAASMHTNTYAYAYDPIGNRTQTAVSLTTGHWSLTTDYTANELNQYTNLVSNPVNPPNPVNPVENTTPAYDLDGNMTFDGKGWHYAWNAENRLTLASNATHAVRYAYDHQGRMVWKETVSPSPIPNSSLLTTNSTQYAWDGFNIIAENITTSEGSTTTYNVWGVDLDGTMQGAGGVGGLLAVIKDSNVYMPCYDANGNVTEYVDGNNGNIAAHYEYDAFGNTVVLSGNLADWFTHRFSTKPYCPILNKVEFQLRIYDPVTGGWMSRDPIGERGGFNLYGFVENDAINWIDVNGESRPRTITIRRGAGWKARGTLVRVIATPINRENEPGTPPSGQRRSEGTSFPVGPITDGLPPCCSNPASDPKTWQEAVGAAPGTVEGLKERISMANFSLFMDQRGYLILQGKEYCKSQSQHTLSGSSPVIQAASCKCCVISFIENFSDYTFRNFFAGVLPVPCDKAKALWNNDSGHPPLEKWSGWLSRLMGRGESPENRFLEFIDL